MKTRKISVILLLVITLLLSLPGISVAAPLGTAFTYQGRLIDSNSVAEGLYDFQFSLHDANTAGSQVGSNVNKPDIDVIDGYFSVELDFSSVFNGDARWLNIGVRPGVQNDPCAYTPLVPRQEVTPAPYALYAASGTPGPKGDTGDTGPQGPMGPEGPAGDAAFSIEDFVALGQFDRFGKPEGIGTISIGDVSPEEEGVFGIRFGISALAPDPRSPSEAVDEVELILEGGSPLLLSMIEDMNVAHTYPDVLVTLGKLGGEPYLNSIILNMRDVTVNSVDFFGYERSSNYQSLAYVSLSIQGDFMLDIVSDDQIGYDVHTGLIAGPDCETEVFNVYPHNVTGVSPPYIPLTDYDVQISPHPREGAPCISTITTKTESYQGTACIWTNCLSLSSIDTVWVRLYSPDGLSLDTSFQISQAFPQRVKIYSINESDNNDPVQMEITYSMNQVVIHDNDQGNQTTVVSCQQKQ